MISVSESAFKIYKSQKVSGTKRFCKTVSLHEFLWVLIENSLLCGGIQNDFFP